MQHCQQGEQTERRKGKKARAKGQTNEQCLPCKLRQCRLQCRLQGNCANQRDQSCTSDEKCYTSYENANAYRSQQGESEIVAETKTKQKTNSTRARASCREPSSTSTSNSRGRNTRPTKLNGKQTCRRGGGN
jgi:hypothetical protein